MTTEALPAESSAAALPSRGSPSRLLLHPKRQRPDAFHARFDSRSLFYDCFWHMDGRRVLLVGPPPVNLRQDYEAARFVALPSRESLARRFHPSLSTMITELIDVPRDTTAIEMTMGQEQALLPVQPSSVAALDGRRLLFGINYNNDLEWIREWALFHSRAHGTDSVILFDNGSSRYEAADVAAALGEVQGIEHVAVPSWPQPFGAFDTALLANPYWAHFVQISSMSVVLRRYGERAHGIINSDIDELAGTISGRSLYDLTAESRGGLVVYRGTWIEATDGGARHRDFTQKRADPKAAHSGQRKWCLDPSRPWVRRLSVHPYWHWIEGRALFSKTMPKDATYWHFKAINTNWKQQRTAAPSGPTVDDEQLAAAMRRAGLVT